MSQSTHQRLYDFAKMALINIFAHPYATVRQALSFHPINSSLTSPFLFSLSLIQGVRFVLCWFRRW